MRSYASDAILRDTCRRQAGHPIVTHGVRTAWALDFSKSSTPMGFFLNITTSFRIFLEDAKTNVWEQGNGVPTQDVSPETH